VDREQILSEIRRTAQANAGVPLGWRRFEEATGIRYHDWYGRHWTKWSDAVVQAGYQPNAMTQAYDDSVLLDCLVTLTRQLGRAPTHGDLAFATKNDQSFPSEKTFRRMGGKRDRVARMLQYCAANDTLKDVLALWQAIRLPEPDREVKSQAPENVGYVYLVKHGRRSEYKIGRTNNPLRREGELRVQLPERLEPLHYIETDDPAGVESYWHMRFASKRKEGEWFALTVADVQAFKRWKRIY
jgi:Meiotically up-regulated gene 113